MRFLPAYLLLALLFLHSCKKKEPVLIETYFESIKDDPEALRTFFQKMPKGGDLHHHASGSPFAEEMIKTALQDSLFIDTTSYQLVTDRSNPEAVLLNSLLAKIPSERDSIIDAWSVRNYKEHGRNGHDQFFGTFPKFMPAFVGHEGELLSILCEKAKKDNISYIETSITVPNVENAVSRIAEPLQYVVFDTTNTVEVNLDRWYNHFQNNNIEKLAQEYTDSMDSYMNATERHGVAMKFQGYGVRVYNNPPMAFGHLLLSFMGAERSDHVVGVNFVAPEDHPAALKNYSLHMDMFSYLKKKYPSVNITLHAGELVDGMGEADSEDLTFHIAEALDAGARRIGHGVDINSEENKEALLHFMRDERIAVEINLESNEVILERTPENHPIRTYYDYGVPFTISTDDEGVLRTDLTNQYVLLLNYLPELSYEQVKKIVYNSIQYAFLSLAEKDALIKDLDQRFAVFEADIQK